MDTGIKSGVVVAETDPLTYSECYQSTQALYILRITDGISILC